MPQPGPEPLPPSVVRLSGVSVRIGGRTILDGIDLDVRPGQRWVILGPNGSGKTTILRIAGGYLHPTRGTVELLGGRLGAVDVSALRARIGQAGPAIRALVRDRTRVEALVAGGLSGVTDPAYRRPTAAQLERAREALTAVGCAALAERPVGSLSTGEQQRVGLARALVAGPDLLLLDEPFAGLDLAGREALVATLTCLAARARPWAVLLVVHNLEEIPNGFDHAALLDDGRLVAAGPLAESLTEARLSEAFGLDLEVGSRDGRHAARARRPA
ncbi:MAG TPA: ATP-binding cassette domain-containing protein [Candidatus Limnocylindrales bacterium]|nr:ATP-binding cassette domain-containing protein [Candidatus Limnocylindrales bacterium]